MKLLLVDDEPISMNQMIQGVDWASCNVNAVYIAYNAREAREICAREQIHILLCDIEMPGENGIELVRHVREQYPEIVCLFLTCHADFAYAREAVRLGCSEYFVKPAPYEEIARTLLRISREIRDAEEYRQLVIYGRQWVASKKEEIVAGTTRKMEPAEIVEKVERMVLEHLSGEIYVEKIAGEIFLSPDHLNRIFKKEKGISINKFIIGERMKMAARMLRETDVTAYMIAEAVGYANYPNFVNMFKKFYGISPMGYKEQMEKGKNVGNE